MARTSSLVLLLLVLYITCTAILASRHSTVKQSCNNDTSFVETSCKSTTYPTVCMQYLSPYASKIQRNPQKMALVAMSVSVSNVQSAKSFLSKQKKVKNLKPMECEAIADCLAVLSDSEDHLKDSVQELEHLCQAKKGQDFAWRMSNVETWVSAALTNEDTCLDGFLNKDMDGKVKDSIRAKVVTVAQITSNALALVEKIAKTH